MKQKTFISSIYVEFDSIQDFLRRPVIQVGDIQVTIGVTLDLEKDLEKFDKSSDFLKEENKSLQLEVQRGRDAVRKEVTESLQKISLDKLLKLYVDGNDPLCMHRIETIRFFRAVTGWGLRDAKDFVEVEYNGRTQNF